MCDEQARRALGRMRPDPVKRDYIVVHDGTVVEAIRASLADEARALQTQPGVLYVKVGGG